MPKKGKKKKRPKRAKKTRKRSTKKKVTPRVKKKRKVEKKPKIPKDVERLLPLVVPEGFQLKFGPAGRPTVYSGSVEEAPVFIRDELSLDAYEVQQSRKITLDKTRSEILGANAQSKNIVLSVHAPYAVNLLSQDKEKIKASVDRLIQCSRIAHWCGARIVVFHPGYYGGLEPCKAVETIIENLMPVVDAIKSENLKVYLGPETMGKLSQFGTVDELVEVAKAFPQVKIVFDVAHIHAREHGSLMDYSSYDKLFSRVESELGSKCLRELHIHYTEVEYGDKGEIRHLVLGAGAGPALDPLLEWLINNDVKAVIISESPILEIDAIRMKHRAIEIYKRHK